MPEPTRSIARRVLDFIGADAPAEADFDALALALFAHQHAHDVPYRRFCQRRGATPRTVRSWRDIPAVPISAFKDATLSAHPVDDCERVFATSGTTRGDVKGRNHHPTLAVWEASMQRHFAARFMAGSERLPMALLFPAERELPNSSLAHYLALAARTFGVGESPSFVGADGIDVDGLVAWLDASIDRGEPVAVLGASYSFVHVFEALERRGRVFALPPGSRILDTGGYKNQARELPLDAFYDALAATFGVPRERCINMYGMTELSSQFYDAGNARVPSVKRAPHWVRSRVVEPLSGRELAAGERGVLLHVDLANFNSVTAILTEDVGIAADGGFLLLGRAEGAEAKGCSMAVQEFVEAAAR
nr:long-chain fatty acid--CoA ligase [Schlegelella koreensis]